MLDRRGVPAVRRLRRQRRHGRDDLPVFVRVGPYNVNPETVFQSASVISHEYGHHLGLPDFYNNDGVVYADLNLMASDLTKASISPTVCTS